MAAPARADRRARRSRRRRCRRTLYPLGTAGIVALASTAVVARASAGSACGRCSSRGSAPGGSRRRGRRWPPPPGCSCNVLAALTWLFNPYAAALLLPAAHLWLFAAAPGSRLRGWAALPRGARRARCRRCWRRCYYALALGPRPARAGVAGALLGGRRRTSRVGRRVVVSRWLALPGRAAARAARAPPGRGDAPSRERARARAGRSATRARLARRHRVGAAAMTAPPRALAARALRVLSTVLIVAGALLLADAVATLLWQEPVSALYAPRPAGQARRTSSAELERAPLAAGRAARARAAARPDAAGWRSRARALERRSEPGDPIGRIRMPAIGVVGRVRRGHRTRATCARARATTRRRRCPGSAARSAIAGHRTTYGAPFRDIDKLRPRRPDRARDALRALHLPRRAHADRAADRDRG